jgi:tetratricopeptide (TPR) repeat protein
MSDSLHAVTPLELSLFIDRIGRSLAERPLDIDVSEHRERVAELVREVGGASFYQLLGVGPAASPEKVHEGYQQVARLVHPNHAPYLGLEGREGVLEVLFERATAAYITLSHPGRRRDYDREMGPEGWAETPSGRSRNEENRDRARANFNRAAAFAAKDEYHFAIELLREAVRIDPQAKYFALLGELQEKNQHWLRHAADSYTRALELGGPDPRIEENLARVFRRLEGGAAPPAAARRRPGGAGGPADGAAAPDAAGVPAHAPAPSVSPFGRFEIEPDGAGAFEDDLLPAPDED